MSNKDNKINWWAPKGATMLSLGHQNFVASHRVVAILESSSLPMKRLREKAQSLDRLVDATAGRRTKAIVITDSQHVFLSAHSPQTLQDRLVGKSETLPSAAQLEVEEGEFVS